MLHTSPFRLVFAAATSIALVACAGSAPSSPGVTGDSDADIDAGADVVATGDTFDLTVHGTGFASQWTLTDDPSIELVLAAQDVDTKERIGWEPKTVSKPADDFTFTWPGRLKRGARYAVALEGWKTYAYFEVPAVVGDVTLELDDAKVTTATKRYLDAFDVLDTRLALPPGTFEAANPKTGTKIAFVVGKEGYLNVARLLYGCSGSTATCGDYGGHSVAPCTRAYVRGDTMKAKLGDSTSWGLSIAATASVQGDGIAIEGAVKRANCCNEPVALVATRTSTDTAGCR